MKKILLTISTLITSLLLIITFTACTGETSENSNELHVGFSPDYAPYEFVDLTKNGSDKYVGSDIEFAKYIASELGMELVLEPMAFNQTLISLQSGKLDLAISGFTYKAERAENFEMSDPYFDEGEGDQIVITLKSNLSKFTSLETVNTKGVLVGAQAGSIQHDLATAQLPNATIETHDNISNMVTYLETGKLDCIALSQTAAEALISTNSNIAIINGKFDVEDSCLYVLAKKGNTELMEKVNGVIEKVQENNLYEGWITNAKALFEALGDNAGQPDLSEE